MRRSEGRAADAFRPIQMQLGFHHSSEGSVLYRAGNTVVLVTASVDSSVPDFLRGKNQGWITAEYQMHPRASAARREARDGRGRTLSGRTQEIQRLIGRALRAAVALDKLGERTITVDCDVIEADGGTRTASITGGFVALALALHHMVRAGQLTCPVIRDVVSASSVGMFADGPLLDLDYAEDSSARVDLNVVGTGRAGLVEVQGTAEGEAVQRSDFDKMLDLALGACAKLGRHQVAALQSAQVDLNTIFLASAMPRANGSNGSTPKESA